MKKYQEYFKQIDYSLISLIIFLSYALSYSTSTMYNFTSFGLFIIWTTLAFNKDRQRFLSIFKKSQIKYLILYLLFLWVTGVYNGGIVFISKLVAETLLTFSPILIYAYYRSDKKYLSLIIKYSLVFITYLTIKSLIFYRSHDNVARILASNKRAFGIIRIGGGYPLAIGVTLLAVFIFDLLVNGQVRKKFTKISFGILYILFFVLVFATKSIITLIGLLLGAFLSILFQRPSHKRYGLSQDQINFKKDKIMRILKWSVGLIIVLIFLNRESIGLAMEDYFVKKDVLSIRLSQIGETLAYGFKPGNYIYDRVILSQRSIKSFIKNPIIGRGHVYGYIGKFKYYYLGGHGEWFDILGANGLIGGSLYFLIYYYSLKEDIVNILLLVPLTYVFIALYLGFFNPFRSFTVMFTLFFIIPAVSNLLKNFNNK